MIESLNRLLLGACLAGALAACAVQQAGTTLAPMVEGELAQRTLDASIELQLNTGYRRTLKQGSRWTRIGRVPQGDVYKPYMDVFTVEGSHIHEAYLVVDSGTLVGFYLPAEQSYSKLDQRTAITFK
jgi:hypothetical protein